jgi:hypothetical protein
MSHDTKGANDHDQSEQWFDDVTVIDDNWVEVALRTPVGTSVTYRLPRRTLFTKVDQAAD